MDKKQAVLLLVLAGGAGYAVHTNWDTIKVTLGLDDLRPGRIRALQMVKDAKAFDQYRANWMVVQDRKQNGEIEVVGEPWHAVEVAHPRYRVTCTFVEDGERLVHAFAVDIVSGDVAYEGLDDGKTVKDGKASKAGTAAPR